MVRVYKCKNFNIYSNLHNGFIIHNTKKPFDEGHTHINNFDTAKFLIKLSIHKSVPDHLSNYLLESLIRINKDRKYIQKLKNIKNKGSR
jgi:hypothetical protein